jgi:hypothetical protein
MQRTILSRFYPSDFLPPHAIIRSGTVILNADPHTWSGSHCFAIRVEPKSSSAFYFDFYGLPTLVPAIESFLRRTSSVWKYNKTQLQGLTSIVCGHYCCLFALCLDEGLSPRQFVNLFGARHADESY